MSSINNVKVWPRKQGNGKALANCQFTYDDTLKLKCTLWQGKDGPFVGFPGSYGTKTDDNGKKIFYPDISILKEKDNVRAEINSAVIAEYNKETRDEEMNQGEAAGPTSQAGKKGIPF